MADAMKFGPQWLRNMSSEKPRSGSGSVFSPSSSTSEVAISYPLTEGSLESKQPQYRYGTEEMLSLCEKLSEPRETLRKFKSLYVEKKQLPLALISTAEDENTDNFPWHSNQLHSAISLSPSSWAGGDRYAGSEFCLSPSAAFPTEATTDEGFRETIASDFDQGCPKSNGGSDNGSGDWKKVRSICAFKEFKLDDQESGIENRRGCFHNDECRDSMNQSSLATSHRDLNLNDYGPGSMVSPRESLNSYEHESRMEHSQKTSAERGFEYGRHRSQAARSEIEFKPQDTEAGMKSWHRIRINDVCEDRCDVFLASRQQFKSNDHERRKENWRKYRDDDKFYGSCSTNFKNKFMSQDREAEEHTLLNSQVVDECQREWQSLTGSSNSNSQKEHDSTITRSISALITNGNGAEEQNISPLNLKRKVDMFPQQARYFDDTYDKNNRGPSIKKASRMNWKNTSFESKPYKIQGSRFRDDIPEWAMENTKDIAAGKFDANGVFHLRKDELDNMAQSLEANTGQLLFTFSEEHKVAPAHDGAKLTSTCKCNPMMEGAGVRENSKSPDLKNGSNNQLSSSLADVKLSRLHAETAPTLVAPDPINSSRTGQFASSPSREERVSTPGPLPFMATVASATRLVTEQSKKFVANLANRKETDRILIENKITTSTASFAGSISQMHQSDAAIASNSSRRTATSSPDTPIQIHHHSLPQPQSAGSRQRWYYLDPQNMIQGPFTSSEMAEWYRFGYFDESLLVSRECDSRFATLSEFSELCGTSKPITSSHFGPRVRMIQFVPFRPSLFNSNKPSISIYDSLINTAEMATSLSIRLQYLQKQYLHHHQTLIFRKLSVTRHFALLSPDWQQHIVQQLMKQVSLPDHLANLPAFINFLHRNANTSDFPMQPTMSGDFHACSLQNADIGAFETTSFQNPAMTCIGYVNAHGMQVLHDSNNVVNAVDSKVQYLPPKYSCQNTANAREFSEFLFRPDQVTTHRIAGNFYLPTPEQKEQPARSDSAENTSVPISMWDYEPIFSHIPVDENTDLELKQQSLEEQRHLLKLRQHPHPPPTECLLNDKPKLETTKTSLPEYQSMPTHDQIHPESLTIIQSNDENKLLQQHLTPEPFKQEQQVQHELSKSEECIAEKVHTKQMEQLIKEQQIKTMQTKYQEEDKRCQQHDETKRQEEIATNRHAKILEDSQVKSQPLSLDSLSERSLIAASSDSASSTITNPVLSFVEVLKSEQEYKIPERQNFINQGKLGTTLTWNIPPIKVKSISEIQAEEYAQKQLTRQKAVDAGGQSSVKDGPLNTALKTKSTDKITKGASSSTRQSEMPISSNADGNGRANTTICNKQDNEFNVWCNKILSSIESPVDVPVFIDFLQCIESPDDVNDYVRNYLGNTKECVDFAKQYLERRSKYKHQKGAGDLNYDDLFSPAQAINPSPNVFQDVKNKRKNQKKAKLDTRIL